MTQNYDLDEIVKLSYKAVENSYSPYSKFPVGAALISSDGSIFLGCNIENGAYSLCTCAERVAICKAVSEGKKDFLAIAICAPKYKSYISPCGSCRQILSEFGLDWDVILCKTQTDYKLLKLKDLLPYSFKFEEEIRK